MNSVAKRSADFWVRFEAVTKNNGSYTIYYTITFKMLNTLIGIQKCSTKKEKRKKRRISLTEKKKIHTNFMFNS